MNTAWRWFSLASGYSIINLVFLETPRWGVSNMRKEPFYEHTIGCSYLRQWQ